MAVIVDLAKCTGCSTCVSVCPSEALKIVDNKAVCSEADCVDCGVCVDECPDKALRLP